MTKVIFLDRDGVINENRPDYVRACSELSLISGAKEALELLKNKGFTIIIVTNQSAVGRGYITEDDLKTINKRLNERLGGLIDDFFYCPHKPEDHCSCRKPKTQLLIDAAEKYYIDLKDKWIIGDNLKDIIMGQSAGLNTILVKTGLGEEVLSRGEIEPDHVAEDLLDAVKWLIENNHI